MTPDPLRIGIVGGTGWLGLALGQNLLRRGVVAPAHLTLLNRRGPTGDYDLWPGVIWASGLPALVAACDVVVLAVRPGDYVPPPPGFGGLVISFMTAITLADLARDWPGARILRAMPGGSATEGTAHVPWTGALGPADTAVAERLLSAIGTVDRVSDEYQLAVMAALSGSGAAYPALMAQAMFGHALAQGIAPDIAWRAVQSVICDAPALLRGDPAQTAALLAAYHGYRGVTAAGLAAAEAAGFADSIGAALAAATDRALTMRRG